LKVSSGTSLIFELQSDAASAKTVAVIKEEVDKESLQRQKLASIRDGFKILLGIGSAISEVLLFSRKILTANAHLLVDEYICQNRACMRKRTRQRRYTCFLFKFPVNVDSIFPGLRQAFRGR